MDEKELKQLRKFALLCALGALEERVLKMNEDELIELLLVSRKKKETN
ncbi:MAG: hypothetical protein WBA15_12460 [Mesorhizobium sp.]